MNSRASALLALAVLAAPLSACGSGDSTGADGEPWVDEEGTPEVGEAPAWLDQFGTSDDDGVASVAAMDGEVYLAGTLTESLDGQDSLGGNDAFVRKYASDGTVQWTRQFGTAQSERVGDIAVSAEAVYVVGTTDGDLAERWTPEGNGPAVDIFLRAFSHDGELLWTTQFDADDETPGGVDEVGGVAVWADGIYVAAGRQTTFRNRCTVLGTLRKFRTSGEPLWTAWLNDATESSSSPSDLVARPEGVYLAGTTPSCSSSVLSGNNSFALRVTHDGALDWARVVDMSDGAGVDGAYSMAVAHDGVYIQGSGTNYAEPELRDTRYFRKFDLEGQDLWSYYVDRSIGRLAAGTGVVGGLCDLDAAAGVALCTYDAQGAQISSCRVGTALEADGRDLLVSAGRAYLVGTTGDAFAGQTHQGGRDIFVASWPVEAQTLFDETSCPRLDRRE